MSAFHAARDFAFTRELELAFESIVAEERKLARGEYLESPDSLTTVANGYDETGWRFFALVGSDVDDSERGARFPATLAACRAAPGLVNAGFSQFLPGTRLYPHRGEIAGVLRCHLPLVVPNGDLGLRIGAETRTWRAGECLVFDDTFEHEAWNLANSERVVLIVTFARP